LEYFCRSFRLVQLLTFRRRLFAKLSEDTVLVLAAGRGQPFERCSVLDLPDRRALVSCGDPARELPAGVPMDARALGTGQERVLQYLLPERTRNLYRTLRMSPHVRRLGELADVGIGYVTGDNDFFHVDKRTVARYQLPERYLRPALRG